MQSSGNALLATSFIVELLVLGGFFAFPSPSWPAAIMVAALVIGPPLLVGYLAGRFGFTYGVVLGVMPAILGLTALPTAFFGLSSVEGAVILFFAYVAGSGLSGAAGQFVAGWRDAA